jgi:hypothetical protein
MIRQWLNDASLHQIEVTAILMMPRHPLAAVMMIVSVRVARIVRCVLPVW